PALRITDECSPHPHTLAPSHSRHAVVALVPTPTVAVKLRAARLAAPLSLPAIARSAPASARSSPPQTDPCCTPLSPPAPLRSHSNSPADQTVPPALLLPPLPSP